jgi:hypothetical protein
MIRPCCFGYNEETAVNNAFQVRTRGDVQSAALREFDSYVALLRSYGVKVDVVQDTPALRTPDSIFPNNWFSTHGGGVFVLYPMFAANRRQERKRKVVDHIIETCNINNLIDLTSWEEKGEFLEGTGSMVLDRINRVVYASISPRTSEVVLGEFCKAMDYKPVVFHASDANGQAVYHTNVMMSIGLQTAVVCLESIKDLAERSAVGKSLEDSGHAVIRISMEQMGKFAGNMLELSSDGSGSVAKGHPLQIMSLSALRALTPEQRNAISGRAEIVAPDVSCIERNGGGSARCMLAELFS